MVFASFQIENKCKKTRFFPRTFLLTHISLQIVLEIPFIFFNNANVSFLRKKLSWRSYTAAEALLITKLVEVIDKKKFAKEVLDKNVIRFEMNVTFFNLNN